jgi:hypothetical protein
MNMDFFVVVVVVQTYRSINAWNSVDGMMDDDEPSLPFELRLLIVDCGEVAIKRRKRRKKKKPSRWMPTTSCLKF